MDDVKMRKTPEGAEAGSTGREHDGKTMRRSAKRIYQAIKQRSCPITTSAGLQYPSKDSPYCRDTVTEGSTHVA